MMSAERGAATNTLSSYERDLEDVQSFLVSRKTSLAGASGADLAAYLSDIGRKGFAPSSQARSLSALRQFYKFLYAEGLRGDDPTTILDSQNKGRALPKTLSEADVSRLWEKEAHKAQADAPG